MLNYVVTAWLMDVFCVECLQCRHWGVGWVSGILVGVVSRGNQ